MSAMSRIHFCFNSWSTNKAPLSRQVSDYLVYQFSSIRWYSHALWFSRHRNEAHVGELCASPRDGTYLFVVLSITTHPSFPCQTIRDCHPETFQVEHIELAGNIYRVVDCQNLRHNTYCYLGLARDPGNASRMSTVPEWSQHSIRRWPEHQTGHRYVIRFNYICLLVGIIRVYLRHKSSLMSFTKLFTFWSG